MSALSRNMDLIKKSRRMLSGIFHARPDSDLATTKSRSKTSLSRRRRFRRGTSRRTMEMMICRGEKRKREDDDEDDDDVGWEFVQCKKRLVTGGAAQVVVGEEHIAPDEIRMPSPLPFHCEALGVEPGELPDGYEELLEKVHSNLENLTITDADGVPLNSRTSTRQPSPEPHTHTHTHTNLDGARLEGFPEGGNGYRYRARRCHSETSIGVPSYANAVTGQLSDDGGRRSAPPNLDTAWSVPGSLDRRASLWSVSALSGDGTLVGMFDEEAALELVLFAESEAEDDVEVEVEVGGEQDVDIRAEEEETQVGTEVGTEVMEAATDAEAEAEEVSIQAAVAAVAEAILRETTLQQIEATVLQADETTLGISEGEREPESEPSPEPVSEQEQEAALTQASEPPLEPASSPTEPISELTFRIKYDSLVNWGLDTTDDGVEPRVCRRQATAEDVASRIRAVKDRMMESLLDIEQRLRPHCSGARI